VGLVVDHVYNAPAGQDGATLLLATVLFAVQIYCDFSGYSDIAIGAARVLGYDLMENFRTPFTAASTREFWSRWHISLSTWFRDYLYIPIGGSRGTKAMLVRNSLIVFAVSGFWHGASWNFLIWGILNGLYFVPLVLLDRSKQNMGLVAEGRILPSFGETHRMLVTFALACLAWVAFRAKDLGDTLAAYKQIFSTSTFSLPDGMFSKPVAISLGCIAVMVMMEWASRDRQYGLALDGRAPRWARFAIYYGVVALIVAFAPLGGGEFIYFQF
jgi:D-alanyl-lipoteichoic acid acyltransferase DltB (MBOAT superfamily)